MWMIAALCVLGADWTLPRDAARRVAGDDREDPDIEAIRLERSRLEAAIRGFEDDGPEQQSATGIVRIRGVMTGSMNEVWADWIDELAGMEGVDSIILSIDSPGGSVAGLDRLAESINAAKAKKPVVAVIGAMGTSAAFYIASQANRIVARKSSMVGSIGTRLTLVDWSQMFTEAGVKVIPIDSAPDDRPFKSAGEMGTEITEQQAAYFQGIVNAYFADFAATVRSGRAKISDENWEEVRAAEVYFPDKTMSKAQGKPTAIKLGLVDSIGSEATVREELEKRRQSRATARRVRGG